MSQYTHLTLTDRCTIERCLCNGYSFKEIARLLNRHPSTISREIKNDCTFLGKGMHPCANFSICRKHAVCDNENCTYPCKSCKLLDCYDSCNDFTHATCPRLDDAPYICINCSRKQKCSYEHAYYHAQNAHKLYLSELSNSRKGVRIDEEQLELINKTASPLLKNGQSLNHIFGTHADDFNCSKRSIYHYIDQGLLDAKNIDLPRKVRYKKRKKRHI